jgi:nudix-type nucleoside diphosphatase (YffH/AdpP family)
VSLAARVRVLDVEVLVDGWSKLKKTTLAFQRRDGTWQTLLRETYDRGDGVAVLVVDPDRRTVLLTRQFRFPAFVNGATDLLTEVCAGKLDDRDPESAIRAELEEEVGVTSTDLRHVLTCYMSPGSVTEKLHFYLAYCRAGDRISAGGGLVEEGEDIEVIEVGFADALAMIDRGEIADGKTILLLLYAQWKQLV